MKKERTIIKKTLITAGIVAPVLGTVISCHQENSQLNEGAQWLKDLEWSFPFSETPLVKELHNSNWFLSKEEYHPLANFNFPDLTVEVNDLSWNLMLGEVKISYKLSDGTETKIVDLELEGWENTYLFSGDLSKYDLTNMTLAGVDLSYVTKWPTNLSGIDWTGVVGLTSENTPFQGDLSSYNLEGLPDHSTKFHGIDVSKVTTWPKNLTGTNWGGVQGLTYENTPFKNDISSLSIKGELYKPTSLKDVDVSAVTTWPTELTAIDWTGIVNLDKSSGNPFKGKLSEFDIFGFNSDSMTVLNGVDVSGVEEGFWVKPIEPGPSFNGPSLNYIDWTRVKGLEISTPFTKKEENSDLSKTSINGNVLMGVDVSKVTQWPTTLSNINWTGVIGLNESPNSPFAQLNIADHNISGSILNGVDVSGTTTWPENLYAIDWTGVINLGKNGGVNPFNGDISESTSQKQNPNAKMIIANILNGVDVSGVVTWPSNLSGIDWTGVIGLTPTYTPFKGDFSTFLLASTNREKATKLAGVDVSGVNRWSSGPNPYSFGGVDWTGVIGLTSRNTPFKENIGQGPTPINLTNAILTNVDLSQVKIWPTDLSGIDWSGVVGLTSTNTPFQGDISNLTISNRNVDMTILSGIDVSGVTKWPTDLKNIDWTGVVNLEQSPDNPFGKPYLLQYDLSLSTFSGIDFRNIQIWPEANLSGINWTNALLLRQFIK